MNIKRIVAVLLVFFLGVDLFSHQGNSQPKNSLTICLYARPEREGSRTFVSVLQDGKPGYLKIMTPDQVGVREIARHNLLQAPKIVTKEERTGTVRNWPVSHTLMISTRTKGEWAEERKNENGIKVPKAFHRIDLVIEAKNDANFDSITIFATDYDEPATLIEKNWIVVSYDSAVAFYDLIESGADCMIALEVSGQ